jgi:P-type conjugative transfer protein TrbJ
VYDPSAVGKLVTQLSRQAQQIATARQQLEAQLTALRKLPSPPWRDVSAAMAQADLLVRQGQAIAYSLQDVDAAFQATFGGTAVTGRAPTAEQVQALRTLATLRGVLDAAARTMRELPVGVNRLRDVKRQMASVQGHEQALELDGAIGVYEAEQLTLVSQQLAALTNAEAVYFAHEVNDRAQTRANTRAFLTTLGAIPADRPGFSFRIR